MAEPKSKERSAKNAKKTYRRPELSVYGSVRDLTAGGVSQTPEGMGQGNQFKMP